MAARALLFIDSGGFRTAYQAATLAVTAAATGDEVYMVFGFDALRSLAEGKFGEPRSPEEEAEAARAKEKGASPPAELLEEARGMGAMVLACDTMLEMCGLSSEGAPKWLDEAMGLPSIWRLAEGASVLRF
jgi:peroxiredoxin family protein